MEERAVRMPRTDADRGFVLLLWLLALATLAWPASRMFLDVEIDVNEAWNAYFDDAAVSHGALYPSRDLLITNNYPPLSFYVVGGLGGLIGDKILAGRLLSFVAVLAIGALVAICLRLRGATWAAAFVGGGFFIATLARFCTDYVGMNDPHLFGLVLMSGGLALFLRAYERDARYWPAFLLMATAGFVKHNQFAVPLATVLWLGWQRPRRLPGALGPAIAAVILGFAACYLAFGKDFFANLTSPRVIDWGRPLRSVGHLQWVAVAVVVWAYVGVVLRRNPRVAFCSVFVLISLASFFIQKAGEGVASYNAMFDLIVALSIGMGLAFDEAGKLAIAQQASPERVRAFVVLALCARVVVSTRTDTVRFLFDPSFREEIRVRQRAAADSIAKVRGISGDVLADGYASYRAGRPFLIDAFNTRQRIRTGELPADVVERFIAQRGLTRVDVDPNMNWSNKYTPPSRE